MSAKKHARTLAELAAHPTARNIEWSDLLAALSSIGDLRVEKNGHFEFTRNGHHLIFARTNAKDVDADEVLKLRHFLRESSFPLNETYAPHEAIVALTYHEAFVVHNPGTATETHKVVHANLETGRLLHTRPTSPKFNDTNPVENNGYFEAVIAEILDGSHIAVLCHGTGMSNASEPLLEALHKKHPEVIGRIIAVENADIENLTEPEVIQRGLALLHPRSA